MRQFSRNSKLCVAILLIAFGCVAQAAEPDATANDKKKPQQTKIKIGKDTTHITGPLDDEGYVDYVAALNEHYSRGVTPENNGAVLFWRAWGPKEIKEERKTEFYEKLGIDPLPVEGDYYLTLRQVAAENPQEVLLFDIDRQWDQAMQRPWNADEFPAITRWLRLNDRQLTLIIEGTRRPKYYTPALRPNDEPGSVFNAMIGILLPMAQQSREFARALQTRAMLRIAEGRTDDAWQDLLACHRLARQIGQGPTLVESLIGYAIDGVACYSDGVLAHHCKITREQYERMQKDLDSLPPLPTVAERIGMTERWMLLDVVTNIAKHGLDLRGLKMITAINMLAEDDESWLTGGLLKIIHSATDWNEVMRRCNAQYDQLVAAASKPTPQEQKEAFRDFNESIKQLAARAKQPPSATELLLQPGKVATEKISDILVALLVPALDASIAAEDRAQTKFMLTKVIIAAGAYRSEHGRYPKALGDLVPTYLAELPKDPFTADDLKYEASKDKLILYSVGPDQEDDGGAPEQGADGDISFKLPPAIR